MRRDPGTAGLGALMLGLLAAPWVYVLVFGALFAFAPLLGVVMAPLLLGATVLLGLEAFGRLRGFTWARRLGVVLSVLVVLGSLGVLSNFTLFTQAERVGLFTTVWLGASLVWLLVSLALGAAGPEALLRSRLTTPVKRGAALGVALLVFGALAVLSWHYLTAPAQFIATRRMPRQGRVPTVPYLREARWFPRAHMHSLSCSHR
jgi:hypothetical protein